MSAFFRYILLLCMLCHANKVLACEQQECISSNSLQLGVSLGAGVRTNPLLGGDNIPLIIIPDIAWYGEQAYFDNGELGFQWLNLKNIAIETFIKLDEERALFSFLHPSNLFLSSTINLAPSIEGPLPPEFDGDDADRLVNPSNVTLSINDLAKRKWAVNGGLRFHYFFKQNEITVSLQQDISQVHKGQVASFAFKRIWQINDNRIKLTAGAHWKSSNLLDYYYGIDQKDTQHSEFYYQGKSGFEPFFSLTLQKPINRHWIWLGSIGSKRLAKGMSDSPIVVEKFIHRVFLGVAYRF